MIEKEPYSFPEPIIRTENLSRYFGVVKAIDDLTLEVPAGIIFGFLGPNGAGKTTTINLLLGLIKPTQGRAWVLGFDVLSQTEDIRANSGVLLEFSGLYERMSAEDNLDFYGRINKMPAAKRKARTQELLEQINLWERRKDRVFTWSRGMKQKLAVARALFHHPPLIFLDEPTAGLDPVSAAALRNDLANLAANEGVTVFLNTHNLMEAENLCAQVGMIKAGKLLTVGNPQDLRNRNKSPKVEIVGHSFTKRIADLLSELTEVVHVDFQSNRLEIKLHEEKNRNAPLINLIVQNGGEVENIKREEASLEEVFLTLMKEEKL